MRLAILFFAAALFFTAQANASNGVISVKSAYNVDETVTRLKSALENKGMRIFATIPHSKGAANVGVELRPTTLVIFGNPKVGAPLMACAQLAAIDLPQKALIHQDENGDVYLSYNDPDYLDARHNIEGCDKVLGKIKTALGNFAKAATK